MDLAATVSLVVCSKLVPFAGYAAINLRRIGVRAAGAILLTFAIFAALADTRPGALFSVLGRTSWLLSYFIAAAWCSYSLRGAFATRAIGSGFVFGASSVLFLILPALIMPRALAHGAILMGWELVFASYSYVVETARKPSTLAECLFFLFLNPVLVFPERGTRHPSPRLLWGAARLAQGVACLAAHRLMLTQIEAWTVNGVALRDGDAIADAPTLASFSLYYFAQCIALYVLHSGGASLQIGSMSFLGWTVPERYHYPFLAWTPAEFWRRWNIYVGSWVRRYVFVPLVYRLRRRNRLGTTAATASAVLASFMVMGALHDVVPLATSWRDAPRATLALTAIFFTHGALLLLWELGSRALRAAALKAPVLTAMPVQGASVALSWTALRFVNLGLAWVAIPALSRGELPRELSRLVSAIFP